MSSNKKKYRDFAPGATGLPLFLQPWWLDAVCGEEYWDVCLSFDKEGRIRGVLTYHIKTWKYFFKVILPPLMTPFSGIWLLPGREDARIYQSNSRRKEILTDLIRQLPRIDFLVQNYHFSLTDWLPFHWAGFKQTTRYTYVLEPLAPEELLFSNIKGSIRTEIRKAEQQFSFSLTDDIAAFYRIQADTFNRKGLKMPYTFDFLKKVDDALKANGVRYIYQAQDAGGIIHSMIYLIRDGDTAYYWAGGADPAYRKSNALTPLIWHGILACGDLGIKRLDFEGSMIPEIEHVFRSFGAVQTPYFSVFKTKNKLFELISILLR